MQDNGHDVVETMIALDQLLEDIKSGEVTEVFACGTAAIITPIGRFVWEVRCDRRRRRFRRVHPHCATSCSASSLARSKTHTTGCGRSADFPVSDY